MLPPYVGLLFSDNYNLTNRSGTFYFLHNNMDFTVATVGQSFIQIKADALISYDKIELLAKEELYSLKKRAGGAENDLPPVYVPMLS